MPQSARMVPFPQAVVFDWDKTLATNWPAVENALNQTLVSEGQDPWTSEEIHLRVRSSARDSFPRLFGDRWEIALNTFKDSFAERQFLDLEPLDGAHDLLTFLQEKQVPASIVSNKLGNYLREEVEHLGWTDRFHAIIGAEDAEEDKPHPAPVDLALKPIGQGRSKNIWFVGDNSIDLHCAHNSGLSAVLVRHAIPSEDAEFERFPPDLHVHDCRALLEVLYEYEN